MENRMEEIRDLMREAIKNAVKVDTAPVLFEREWPTLYKQNNTGKIQQWTVFVDGRLVTVAYGQSDGKLQTSVDIIKSGKNLGKSNETTPEGQALLKAQQLFDKKIKEGYVENITDAQENKNNLEGVEPMLAFDIEKKKNHVTYPAYVQPKLDGFRCIAVVVDGEAKLFSRTQKEITTLPHIIAELQANFQDIILDGELYSHELKHEFNTIASLVKRDEIHPDHERIEYHVYDTVMDSGFTERNLILRYLLQENDLKSIVYVPTRPVSNEKEVEEHFHRFLSEGYEGAMYRNPSTHYEHKRSASLLKLKVFEDDEFVVVGAEEGSGKLMGTAGAIKVVDPNWTEEDIEKIKKATGKDYFKAKLKSFEDENGKRTESKEAFQARCKDWLVNIDNYKGKMLTVKFQGRSVYNVPRFPIALRLREDL
jgi:DNA ligase 1